MKKTSLILFAVLLLSLFGCARGSVSPEPAIAGGEQSNINCNDYQSYETFLATSDLPKNFIRYERLRDFGDFVHFCSLSEDWSYCSYFYELIDENQYQFFLYIDELNDLRQNATPDGETIKRVRLLDPVEMGADLRFSPEKGKSVLLLNDVQYTYADGQIVSIEWNANGNRFRMQAHSSMESYPIDRNATLYSQLLTQNTALQATAAVRSIGE